MKEKVAGEMGGQGEGVVRGSGEEDGIYVSHPGLAVG